jgi:Fic family protein
MNSYYSNLIEGHPTLPRDIEKAQKQDFSDQPSKRENQHLARAHIEVEQAMMDRLRADPGLSIHSDNFVGWLHREFYQRLPEDLRYAKKKDGSAYPVLAGEFRDHEVSVGRHQPPASSAVTAFMDRFAKFYGSLRIPATSQLVALAAAHHRLAWIHPFTDGNGRVTRLFSHACLARCGVDAVGLWTLSRGIARKREDYYAFLSRADASRENDFDGRGNLSDRGLAEFCLFFLEIIKDQIEFMASLLELSGLARRMRAYLDISYPDWSAYQREQMGRLLKAALVDGEVERGDVPVIIGKGATSASAIIQLALKAGLLESPSARGKLGLVFDSKVLDYYFPKLYLELPA